MRTLVAIVRPVSGEVKCEELSLVDKEMSVEKSTFSLKKKKKTLSMSDETKTLGATTCRHNGRNVCVKA